MSRIFGPVFQNGYVVADLDAELEKWTSSLGVGPFFRVRVFFKSYRHRGIESSPVLDVALGHSGGVQIELVQQVNDAPTSQFAEFIREHGGGLQHLGVQSADFEADRARFASLGIPRVAEGVTGGGGRADFYDVGLHPGAVIEVLDARPALIELTASIRAASLNWDGRDPIRPVAALPKAPSSSDNDR